MLARTFSSIVVASLAILLGMTITPAACAQQSSENGDWLWEIGTADRNTAEFLLAPNRYGEFPEDPVYVVGRSTPRDDWPYVHPGPDDNWAGNRRHTFAILFALEEPPESDGLLRIDLVDTHDRAPPRLRIQLGGRTLAELDTPPGGPDETVYGEPSKGRPHTMEIALPADALQAGTNMLTIETLAGSWILYDRLALSAPGAKEAPIEGLTVLRGAAALPVLKRHGDQLRGVVQLDIIRGDDQQPGEVHVDGKAVWQGTLPPGVQSLEVPVEAVENPRQAVVELYAGPRAEGDEPVGRADVELKPVRQWEVYLIPHSHVDIGYTEVQTKVEQDHWRFYEEAIEAARKTADYPEGAQFKWNVEVLWATDSYLRQASPEKREEFIEAVRKGWIGLQALYGNELTALCRPEELMRLVDCAERISVEYDLPIDTAMISDVPGYTWGLTSVFDEGDIGYMSIGPNGGHRIGYTLREWGDKAFYWRSPSGEHRVLCWIPRRGYWRGFRGTDELLHYLNDLEETDYPYDLVQLRYCLGDNAGPGVELSELAKDWNTRYAYPKMIIATASETMHALEDRYGDEIPEVSGDFTPYWEDGAASSSLETGWNRDAAERLSQAEAIWGILDRGSFPAEAFDTAWRDVILYDEHTWGAHNSISEPDSDFAQAQWAIKRQFAVDAKKQSITLLRKAAEPVAQEESPLKAVMVFNTEGWARSEIVTLPPDWPRAGDRVLDPQGKEVPSQRLSDGGLAFLASDVPPYAAHRYSLAEGSWEGETTLKAAPDRLQNGRYTVEIDQRTGSIVRLIDRAGERDLVDASEGYGLGAYFYVAGRDPANAELADEGVTCRVVESGPLMAAVESTGPAPGCEQVVRRVTLARGMDNVRLDVTLDKLAVRDPEGVHIAFPFQVPEGVVRVDTAFAMVRPNEDQLPGACKNYFTASRGVDISNDQFGVTWATRHAPLVEIGGIHMDVLNWQNPDSWIAELEPSTRLFSYVMNNYWETNYKADQEGPTPFSYAIRPHGAYDAAEAKRFGMEHSRPLRVVPCAIDAAAPQGLLLGVEPDGVLPVVFRPTRDGEALLVQLLSTLGESTETQLTFRDGEAPKVYRSNLREERLEAVEGALPIPPWEVVTLRIEP